MRDYGEILNSMRICLNVDRDSNCLPECFGCKYITHDHHVMDMVRDAADAIEELLAAVPKWISVEERLPGKDDMVFVYYEWTGQSGTVYKEMSLSTLGEIQHFGVKPIAWMPLPDPPKEVE